MVERYFPAGRSRILFQAVCYNRITEKIMAGDYNAEGSVPWVILQTRIKALRS